MVSDETSASILFGNQIKKYRQVSLSCVIISPTRLVMPFVLRVILIKLFATLRREVDTPRLEPCLSMRRNTLDFLRPVSMKQGVVSMPIFRTRWHRR